MGGTDGVGSHILKQFNLMAQSRTVYGCTERTKVVMIAYTLEFCRLAVEEEPLFWNILDGADAETGIIGIYVLAVDAQRCLGCVQSRIGGRPKVGIGDNEILLELLTACNVERRILCHFLAFGVQDYSGYVDFLPVGPFLNLPRAVDFHTQVHRGIVILHNRSGYVSAPHGNMDAVGVDNMDIAVQTGAGVPARGAFLVLQFHNKLVVPGTDGAAGIYCEGIVAVGPVCQFLAVNAYACVAHGSVEKKHNRAPCRIGNIEGGTVHSLAYEWQTARSSGLYRFLFLAILLHGNSLEVIIAVKRSVNGPVVRNAHVLPVFCFGKCPARELPAVVKGCFYPLGET